MFIIEQYNMLKEQCGILPDQYNAILTLSTSMNFEPAIIKLYTLQFMSYIYRRLIGNVLIATCRKCLQSLEIWNQIMVEQFMMTAAKRFTWDN